ncbi:unnamed protein product [Phytophthora lilii]|uniref:Unnamed protein product n=1 Tax=Phytophthora lilii TaxID=2077276 RepID=A0A9W6TYQ5_9STRA|nr:unnamed protein product [Phytophthora lilii]
MASTRAPTIPSQAKTVNPNVEIFVKRLPATTADPETASNVWMLQGGPGYSSTDLSYGTILLERLMHLDPPEVIGYILDGIATASGASADKFLYMSDWDTNFDEVASAFLALCEEDYTINTRFATNTISDTLQNLLQKFDNHPNST